MKTKPHEFLQHVMEARSMKQIDLGTAIELDRGTVSAIVNGKKKIGKELAKKLGAYFNVDPSTFI